MERSKRGLLDLKFLDGAFGDVLGGGADGFIADVEAVHLDAGGAAEAAAEGDGREPVLGGIEVAAVLDLHSGFELCEIEEISSVDGQVFNLLAGQDPLHGGLLGIDLNFCEPALPRLDWFVRPAALRCPQS